jgi:hypothetical protein
MVEQHNGVSTYDRYGQHYQRDQDPLTLKSGTDEWIQIVVIPQVSTELIDFENRGFTSHSKQINSLFYLISYSSLLATCCTFFTFYYGPPRP